MPPKIWCPLGREKSHYHQRIFNEASVDIPQTSLETQLVTHTCPQLTNPCEIFIKIHDECNQQVDVHLKII